MSLQLPYHLHYFPTVRKFTSINVCLIEHALHGLFYMTINWLFLDVIVFTIFSMHTLLYISSPQKSVVK